MANDDVSGLDGEGTEIEKSFVRLLRLSSFFIVGLVVALAIAGATYEAIASARDRRMYPPPGRLVDIGGRRLHINCMGEGSPAIILDAGLGNSSTYWFLVQPEIAKFTQVCSYDRAGLGWSDQSLLPRTAHQIASDLDALLTRTVRPPYILVGHSCGGYWSRVYTSEHSEKVVGLVFVDSADKEQNQRFGTLFKQDDEDDARFRRRGIALMPLGVPRMFGWCNTLPYDLPPFKPKLAELTALSCRKSAFETFGYEWSGFANEEKEVESLGSVPLVVLSHDPKSWSSPGYLQAQTIWDQMQVELTRLSSNGERIVAAGSGHDIHVERPELVIQAVRRVYDSALHHAAIKTPASGGQLQ